MNKNKKLLLSVLLLVGIVVGVTLSAGLHYWNTEEAVEDETAESGNITEEAHETADETPHGSTRLGVSRSGVTVSGKSDTRELTEDEKEKIRKKNFCNRSSCCDWNWRFLLWI